MALRSCSRPSASSGISLQAVTGEEERRQRLERELVGIVVTLVGQVDAVVVLDLVEDRVDQLLVIGTDEQDLVLPTKRQPAGDEMGGDQLALARLPLGQVVLGGSRIFGKRDRLARYGLGVAVDPQPHLDLGDDLVGGLLRRLGHDQFVAIPRVRDLGISQGRRELGHLFERPAGQVVVHPRGVGVLGVPIVGHGT